MLPCPVARRCFTSKGRCTLEARPRQRKRFPRWQRSMRTCSAILDSCWRTTALPREPGTTRRTGSSRPIQSPAPPAARRSTPGRSRSLPTRSTSMATCWWDQLRRRTNRLSCRPHCRPNSRSTGAIFWPAGRPARSIPFPLPSWARRLPATQFSASRSTRRPARSSSILPISPAAPV